MAKSIPHSYQVVVEKGLPAMMRDGVTLYADVYRPEAAGRFPVLVMRLPYNKDLFGLDVERGFGHYFAHRGYMVVMQDTRGRFSSEGDFYPLIHEAEDGYDTIEWAAQLPWGDGRVGTVGQSYYGATQYLLAPTRPPHLVACAPISAPSDWWESWIYHSGGVFELGWLITYTIGMAADTARRLGRMERLHELLPYFGVGEESAVAFEEAIRMPLSQEAYRKLPVSAWGEILADIAPFFRYYLSHPDDGPYWWQLNLRQKHHLMTVPMYHIGSWYDIFLEGTIQHYLGLREQAATPEARAAQKMIIAPWPHLGRPRPYTDPHTEAGEADFGPEAAIELQDLTLRWFDYWLKGVQNGIMEEPPVTVFVMGDNVWRQEEEWPPARARYTPYYLHSGSGANTLSGDGVLSPVPPVDEPPDHYTYDPEDPTPTRGGNNLVIPAGVYDQRPVETRPDVLVYTSDVLTQDLEVTGPLAAKLFAASSAPDTDFAAKLVDVRPDGYAHNVQDGILRTRYRFSKTHPSPLKPGEVYEFTIDLWATSYVFKAGHRLRLEVASANFPRFDRNLNVREHPLLATQGQPAQQTVFHDASRPSHILLPVIPR
ncbi:MAG: CocE/NonD family hydrolase [Dehalococcoidia bacterium]